MPAVVKAAVVFGGTLALTSEPGLCGTRNMTAVLSWPVLPHFWWPITAERVSL